MEYKSPQISELETQLYCDSEIGSSVDQPIDPAISPGAELR